MRIVPVVTDTGDNDEKLIMEAYKKQVPRQEGLPLDQTLKRESPIQKYHMFYYFILQ